MSSIQQVDPIALRQKLKKLGIGSEFKLSGTFSEDAVRDTLNKHSGEAEIVSEGTETYATVTGDVDCTCPKCGHEWEQTGVTLEDDAFEIEGDVCTEACTLDVPESKMSPAPHSLVLEPAELAYCLDAWARVWD